MTVVVLRKCIIINILSNDDVFILQLKSSRFLACLEGGLCLEVSGDTPISLLVSFTLFNWPLRLSKADMEHLAMLLKVARSSTAFSSLIILILQELQMWLGSPSFLATGTSSKLLILETNCFCIEEELNSCKDLFGATSDLHSLQTMELILTVKYSDNQWPCVRVVCLHCYLVD